jgi:AAA domain
MVESVSMALGLDLLDNKQPLERPLRIWYHNGEDPMDELKRRLAAICQHYEISLKDLLTGGNFFMTSGNEVPLRVAASYSQVQVQTDHRLVKCIAEQIGDNKIDAASFDPLVTLHAVPESDRQDGWRGSDFREDCGYPELRYRPVTPYPKTTLGSGAC